MFKIIKQLTSVVAMFAVLFAFSTETMAAKKTKTLENTKKRGFVRCGHILQTLFFLCSQEFLFS